MDISKKTNCTIDVAKAKVLISCAVTAQLICVFVFAYVSCWFSDAVPHIMKVIVSCFIIHHVLYYNKCVPFLVQERCHEKLQSRKVEDIAILGYLPYLMYLIKHILTASRKGKTFLLWPLVGSLIWVVSINYSSCIILRHFFMGIKDYVCQVFTHVLDLRGFSPIPIKLSRLVTFTAPPGCTESLLDALSKCLILQWNG